jgi:hypothetical protein
MGFGKKKFKVTGPAPLGDHDTEEDAANILNLRFHLDLFIFEGKLSEFRGMYQTNSCNFSLFDRK